MCKYDVFLSFDEDTRTNFTDHLYAALTRQGIIVFRDDQQIQKEEHISPYLLKVIEESKISVIVFSKNYASSAWRLDEVGTIVEYMNKKQQHVVSIYYDVDPSVVRKQIGVFQEAFAKHEILRKEKVQWWRNTLREVANLSGFHSKDRYESEFIEDIVKDIQMTLTNNSSMVNGRFWVPDTENYGHGNYSPGTTNPLYDLDQFDSLVKRREQIEEVQIELKPHHLQMHDMLVEIDNKLKSSVLVNKYLLGLLVFTLIFILLKLMQCESCFK